MAVKKDYEELRTALEPLVKKYGSKIAVAMTYEVSKETHSTKWEERAQRIMKMMNDGQTMASIARDMNMSPSREREIVHREQFRAKQHVAVVDPSILESLGLSIRTFNALKRIGIDEVDECVDVVNDPPLNIRNFGEKSREKLRLVLLSRGYILK